jgi:flagellar protein FlaG
MDLNNINNISSIPLQTNYQHNTNTVSKSNIDKESNSSNDSFNEKKNKAAIVKDLKSSIDKANKIFFKNNTHLQFKIHDETHDVIVKIVDDVSGEVLKEIPPEKFIDMMAKICEVAGIFVDEKR